MSIASSRLGPRRLAGPRRAVWWVEPGKSSGRLYRSFSAAVQDALSIVRRIAMAEPQPDGVIPPPPHRRADFRRRAQELFLLEVAIADSVLGCHNRAYLVHRVRDEIARRQRYGQRLSLLLVEADRPIRGPEEGALKGIASIARLTVR